MKAPQNVLAVGLALLLAVPARATWSIVALDRATGEVCVASATCVSSLNLARVLPVIVVGEGAAAAQSVPDASGQNRLLIRDLLLAGATPAEILTALEQNDISHQTRQYGIVGFEGPPVTFTGQGPGAAALGVVGREGTIEYAIQGNVLTGAPVIEVAEAAFLSSGGDLSQRVMAAMEGARSMGGDGRCSCDAILPTSCGSPPPQFDKSAHAAFILLARLGDTDGPCDTIDGCAAGSYYLRRNVIQQVSEPDPVIELARRYARWRGNKSGLPDHVLSEVELSAPQLPADGLSQAQVTLRLVDLDGVPLTTGGQTVTVTDVTGGPSVAVVGPVIDQGDGTHRFSLSATTTPGVGRFRIVVQEGTVVVQLAPDLELTVDPASDLHVGFAQVSSTAGATVPVIVNRGPVEAGRDYLILASASGTSPGTPFGGGILPLNEDRVLRWTLSLPAIFPGGAGQLDALGRAEADLQAAPGLLVPFVGSRFDFCAVLGAGSFDFSGVDGFDVLP